MPAFSQLDVLSPKIVPIELEPCKKSGTGEPDPQPCERSLWKR